MELSFMSLDSRSTALACKGKGLPATDLKKFNNHHRHHHAEPTTCFFRPCKSKISVAVAEINITGGSDNSNQKKKPQQQQKHVLLSHQVIACGSRDANATPATDDSIFNFDNVARGILPPVTENESETAFDLQPAEEIEGKKNENKKTDLSSVVNTINGIPGGGTRAGLFRTPISGGVQSATSAHGLPHPALAVRNLMEQARFSHLSTVMSRMHQRRRGYPFGSLVDFAPDSMGHPIFSLSPLAIHTRNLLADPRCSLVVQIPGWSGLSNARVTIFGDIRPLPDSQQDWAHAHYTAKHPQGASQQWGNFHYYRMEAISDVYFIGGFGTVAWVDVQEYENMQPDKIAVNGVEQTLKELNAMFSKPLKTILSTETEVDDVSLISIDSRGTDIRVRQGAQFNVQRLSFESGSAVETLDEAKIALQNLIDKFRKISRTT